MSRALVPPGAEVILPAAAYRITQAGAVLAARMGGRFIRTADRLRYEVAMLAPHDAERILRAEVTTYSDGTAALRFGADRRPIMLAPCA